jgi:predicted ferric reductase
MAIDINLRGPLAGLLTLLPGVDIYLNFGKLALLFITTGVLVGYFRTKPFLRRNWRKLHILNYLAFIFVAVHSWNLGTDVKSFPFVATFFLANVVVNALIIRKLYLLLIGNWGRIFSPPETN